jgi:16S rRNA processing protein RimM
MYKQQLEAGKIVNTHGVRGEVKIQPWANTPDFLTGFKRFFIDGKPVAVKSARVHKDCVITAFEGVEGIDGALKLKNKVVYIDRNDVSLEEGEHFVSDLIGLSAVEADTGDILGKITEVISLPANDVYVISGEREILVPAVPEFIKEVNLDTGTVRLKLIEGM